MNWAELSDTMPNTTTPYAAFHQDKLMHEIEVIQPSLFLDKTSFQPVAMSLEPCRRKPVGIAMEPTTEPTLVTGRHSFNKSTRPRINHSLTIYFG